MASSAAQEKQVLNPKKKKSISVNKLLKEEQ